MDSNGIVKGEAVKKIVDILANVKKTSDINDSTHDTILTRLGIQLAENASADAALAQRVSALENNNFTGGGDTSGIYSLTNPYDITPLVSKITALDKYTSADNCTLLGVEVSDLYKLTDENIQELESFIKNPPKYITYTDATTQAFLPSCECNRSVIYENYLYRLDPWVTIDSANSPDGRTYHFYTMHISALLWTLSSTGTMVGVNVAIHKGIHVLCDGQYMDLQECTPMWELFLSLNEEEIKDEYYKMTHAGSISIVGI